MLTIQKEQKVRALLETNLPSTEIAHTAEVSRQLVYKMRKLLSVFETMPIETRDKIRLLLRAGFPIGAVVSQTYATRKQVLAVRRYYLLCKCDSEKTIPCPTCGSMIFPKVIEPKGQDCRAIQHNISITTDNFMPCLRLVEDVVALGALQLITNPLFYHITQRAKQILEKNYGEAPAQVHPCNPACRDSHKETVLV